MESPQLCGVPCYVENAPDLPVTRGDPAAFTSHSSEGLQPRQERPVDGRRAAASGRVDFAEGLALGLQVGLDVTVGGCQIDVPEPAADGV